MAKHRRDLEAAGALDVHEVGVRMRHETLQLVPPMLILGARVQEILGKLETVVWILDSKSKVLKRLLMTKLKGPEIVDALSDYLGSTVSS